MKKPGLATIVALAIGLPALVAILWPVYSTSGGVGPERVAHAIDQARIHIGHWPTRTDEVIPYIGRHDSRHEYAIAFLPIETKTDFADYVVSVNGDVRRFRTFNGALTDQKTPVTTGVLPGRGFW